jgi:serine/threonine protein kinase
MASTLNERYEIIERRPSGDGDFAQVSYVARIVPKSISSSESRVVLLRQLPWDADVPKVRSAAARAAEIPQSQNISRFFGIAEISGQSDIEDGAYLVTEFARGISLRERIRRVAPFSLAVSIEIGISICQAVMAAESVGLTHSDLQPNAVLLTPEGVVKVTDFQIGEAISDAIDKEAICRDDRRAIGLMLYEMLTGVAPDQLIVADENSPRQLNANVPPALDGIVRKATSLNVDKQYRDVSRILADLQSARDDLRSGKALSWSPLAQAPAQARTAIKPPVPTTKSSTNADDRTKNMNTVRKERNKDLDDEADYPIWSKILLTLLAVIVLVGIGAGTYLFTIFSVPSDVVVPNLIGKQFSEAQKIAESDHFNLVKAKDNYSDVLAAGAIYDEDPAPGRSIKAGKDVSVTVSDGPRLIQVPDLSAMTLARAVQTLSQSGLPQGSVSYQYSESVTKGIVVSEQPAASSNIAHDTPVDIVVSKGPPPPAAPAGLSATSSVDGEIDLTWNDVPDAVTYNIYRDGTKLQSGLPQAAYSDVNLGPGESHSYSVTGVDENGESAKSTPVTGTTITEGAPPATDSATTSGQSTTDSQVPSPVSPKQRRFDIQFKVPPDGPHNCQIEVQDTTGTNIVYDQDRNSSDIVDDNVIGFGNKVIFRIFIDGKLIRQDTK